MEEKLSVKKFKQDKKNSNYRPSREETEKLSFVKKRFKAMQQQRTVVDKDWDTYQTMIDAIYLPYPDERSSSVVPLASSLIELYVAEAMKLETQFLFKSETSEYNANAKALEYVREYDWRKNKRKREFLKNEYIAAGFGSSGIYTGFEAYEYEQQDPIIDDDMKLSWEKKTIPMEKIEVKNIDIRQFYIDNQAIEGIEDAADCIYIQWIGYEQFQRYKSNPLYKNIDEVKARQYDNDYRTFVEVEETTKSGDFVKLTHYWNVERDMYVIMANDNIIIREHPMVSTIDGVKALPFAFRILGKKNYSIYGRGLCESLMMFNSEVNNLRELLMDGIRRSNSQTLAIGNGLTFDGRTFSYENEILTFDGELSNNFQQLSGNPPNQAIFAYLDRLYKDIAVFTGIDIQNLIGEPQQTAFQTEVQREASQKRVNVWLTNRDLAYERFADLYKDLLKMYFPRKNAEGLYPVIETEDEKLENGKFRKKKGKHTFEVTPELLRGDIYIDVHTNTTAPTINAVDRQQKLDLLNTVGQIAQGYAAAEQAGFDLNKVLPMNETMRDIATDYNLEPTGKDNQEEVNEAKQKLLSDLEGMKNMQPKETPEMPEGGLQEAPAPEGAPLPPMGGGGQPPAMTNI